MPLWTNSFAPKSMSVPASLSRSVMSLSGFASWLVTNPSVFEAMFARASIERSSLSA